MNRQSLDDKDETISQLLNLSSEKQIEEFKMSSFKRSSTASHNFDRFNPLHSQPSKSKNLIISEPLSTNFLNLYLVRQVSEMMEDNQDEFEREEQYSDPDTGNYKNLE